MYRREKNAKDVMDDMYQRESCCPEGVSNKKNMTKGNKGTAVLKFNEITTYENINVAVRDIVTMRYLYNVLPS